MGAVGEPRAGRGRRARARQRDRSENAVSASVPSSGLPVL